MHVRCRSTLVVCALVLTLTPVVACGGGGSSSTTAEVGAGGGGQPAPTTSSTSSTTTTPDPTGGGCPEGVYELRDPGSGLPFQISSGGTGSVLTITDDRVELSFDDYVTASGTASGGTFSIDASGVITARLVGPSADGSWTLADVDASGITGEQTITLDGGEPITISGPEFTELATGLAPVGPGATLSCSPSGDIDATAGPITQTYVRR